MQHLYWNFQFNLFCFSYGFKGKKATKKIICSRIFILYSTLQSLCFLVNIITFYPAENDDIKQLLLFIHQWLIQNRIKLLLLFFALKEKIFKLLIFSAVFYKSLAEYVISPHVVAFLCISLWPNIDQNLDSQPAKKNLVKTASSHGAYEFQNLYYFACLKWLFLMDFHKKNNKIVILFLYFLLYW